MASSKRQEGGGGRGGRGRGREERQKNKKDDERSPLRTAWPAACEQLSRRPYGCYRTRARGLSLQRAAAAIATCQSSVTRGSHASSAGLFCAIPQGRRGACIACGGWRRLCTHAGGRREITEREIGTVQLSFVFYFQKPRGNNPPATSCADGSLAVVVARCFHVSCDALAGRHSSRGRHSSHCGRITPAADRKARGDDGDQEELRRHRLVL